MIEWLIDWSIDWLHTLREQLKMWLLSSISLALYFSTVFYYSKLAAACLLPFIPLFNQHLGLNAAENGIIFGALPFIAMISKPSAGALSDKFKAPFTLLRIFSVVQLIFMAGVYFVPQIAQPLPPVHNISCLSRQIDYDLLFGVTEPSGNFTCDVTLQGKNIAWDQVK